jgi:hypothetical protein
MKQIVLILTCFFISTTLNAQDADPWDHMTPNDIHKMLGEYVGG